MKKVANDYRNVKGWGIDADPENEPTYPMKQRNSEDNKGMVWTRPPLQPQNVEILKSIEHPRLPAAFGTSMPPNGLSGMIRRFAFRYSEGSFGHWLPLLLADRINVVEGIFEDLRRGRIPNIFAEMGLKAELRHNPRGFARKLVIGTALIGTVIAFSAYQNKHH